MIALLLVDAGKTLDRHDAFDSFHAVVPASYCDLVLLDGHWATAVNRVREAIHSAGSDLPVATAFSKRDDGVERFLRTLEAPQQDALIPAGRVSLLDIDGTARLPHHLAMPHAPWSLPWLRLHLAARELLTTSPASPDWPEVKRELVRCAELRRALIAAGWVN